MSDRPSSFAPDRAGHGFDPSAQEAERGLISDGVFGEGGLFGRHLDGVAIEAGHGGDTILDRAVGRAIGFDAAEARLQRSSEITEKANRFAEDAEFSQRIRE